MCTDKGHDKYRYTENPPWAVCVPGKGNHVDTLTKLKAICGEILADNADTGNISRETNLRSELGITSLYMIWMALAIEDSFGIRLSDIRLEELVTVGDICDFIEAQQAARGAGEGA